MLYSNCSAATDPLRGSDGPVLGRLDPVAATGFGRRSAIRRRSVEPAVGLLLLRTLTMEVAHTKVGAGVAKHSAFGSRPLRRGVATADAAVRLVWGSPEVARGAARQVYRVHDRVHGELPEPSCAWPSGEAYTAHDASLLLWVWATLVDATQVAHARWLEPLEGARGDSFYADMVTFARFFGIPEPMVPPDRHEFAAYFEGVVAGGALMPTPATSSMVRRILWSGGRRVPDVAVRPARVLAIGTLDPRIRERFDLGLSAADRRLFELMDGTLERAYRYRPAWLLQQLPPLYLSLRHLSLRHLSWGVQPLRRSLAS